MLGYVGWVVTTYRAHVPVDANVQQLAARAGVEVEQLIPEGCCTFGATPMAGGRAPSTHIWVLKLSTGER